MKLQQWNCHCYYLYGLYIRGHGVAKWLTTRASSIRHNQDPIWVSFSHSHLNQWLPVKKSITVCVTVQVSLYLSLFDCCVKTFLLVKFILCFMERLSQIVWLFGLAANIDLKITNIQQLAILHFSKFSVFSIHKCILLPM